VHHEAYIVRPFLSLAFILLSSFYAVYRLSGNISHWTDIAAGYCLGALLALYLVRLGYLAQ